MTHQRNEDTPLSKRHPLALTALAALGVVYGDIGTSPLYAFRECFAGGEGLAVSPENVLGILSLIVWALITVVSIKYLGYVMRADNKGEGGILSLTTLVLRPLAKTSRLRSVVILVGLFGACLMYGDGMITPAISVLSAVEGLGIAAPALTDYVLPITIGILVLLFAWQSRGTSTIGAIFGPVMVVWFLLLAGLGVPWILRAPEVLSALSPGPAIRFLIHNRDFALLVLGGVFLVATGGEALYADMGHFGKAPIRRTWFFLVFPCLVLHYFGQGALLILQPEAVTNPFYLLAPGWLLYPLMVLSTFATVIASQAVITGVFSLTHQAVQLGYLPRMEVRHTSAQQAGQIYVPLANWILLGSTIGLALGFGSSANLAGAYGVAVVTTMVVTTGLGFLCSRLVWKWGLWAAASVSLAFLLIDLGFLTANVMKIPDGGWFPLLVAALTYFLMVTWRKGHSNVKRRLAGRRIEFPEFLEDLREHDVGRVPGLAVYLDGNPAGVPPTLIHNLAHNRVVHEQVVILTIEVQETPSIPHEERLEVIQIAPGFFRAIGHFGFLEQPNIPALLREARDEGVPYEGVSKTSFFLGRETLVRGKQHAMLWWRESLFIFMSRNQRGADQHFGVPAGRVVELGLQVPV